MKKLIFIATLLAGSSVFAQQQKALDHFTKAYPNAEDVYWDEYEEHTEASFMLNDQSKFAHYTTDGTWIETMTDITEEELPAKVKTALAKATSIDNVSSITFIEQANGTTKYDISVETETESYTLIYSPEGVLIKKVNNEDIF